MYFLADDVDRRHAQKPGGAYRILPFEVRNGEEIYQREPSHNETPERIFERRWALALLDRVLSRLRNEFVSDGQGTYFDRLKAFLLGPPGDIPYVKLAEELETTEGALKVAVHRLRKRYREVLRAEISETVAGPEEIEGEIRDLAGASAKK